MLAYIALYSLDDEHLSSNACMQCTPQLFCIIAMNDERMDVNINMRCECEDSLITFCKNKLLKELHISNGSDGAIA